MGLRTVASQVTITAIPALALASNENRKKLILENTGSAPINWSFDLADVNSGTQFVLGAFQALELNEEEDGDLAHQAIYASTNVNIVVMTFMEVVPDMG